MRVRLKSSTFFGAVVAQSVKLWTPDFGSGGDLGIITSSPMGGSVLSGKSAGDSLLLRLSENK